MEISITYIISQIFTILTYGLLAISYYGKSRKNVLIISFLSVAANTIAYILLNAYTGVAMCIVALIRNIIFLIDERRNGKRETINKTDIIILTVLYTISIISAVFTYDGFFSLLSVLATLVYTFSVWQKKTNVYKLLGIVVGFLWIWYNIYIMSIVGIILETILLICSTTGYLLEISKKRMQTQKVNEN